MTTIKLNRYYPHLTENITLEVSDEIAVVLSTGGCQCDSYKRRKREHDECSLDGTPGFEADVTSPVDPGGNHGAGRGPRRPLCRP